MKANLFSFLSSQFNSWTRSCYQLLSCQFHFERNQLSNRSTEISLCSDKLTDMVFLCWARPSPEQQKSCINKSGTFNYDTKYKGATAKPVSCIKDDKELSKDGYLVNHARVLVGSGLETYEKGKEALQNWRHFGLNWAFVDPKTPIQSGVKFCVCLKEFLPWVMMPLQVVYVKENTRAKTKKAVASFGFGSGTLQGHLLAGEERFSIELDENDQEERTQEDEKL